MKRIFLLGGHDLEMLEIKSLLQSNNCEVYDAGLRWDNAELDAYHDVLKQNPDAEFVGIELHDPKHTSSEFKYTLIDHHNEKSNSPAAILQVAKLLNIEPDSRMRLVAANDSGHIPALEAMNATDEEIEYIRKEDRRAQGVTEQDEALCEEALKNKIVEEGVTIIHSPIENFSYFTDKLYPCRKLLVYSDKTLTFYGVDSRMLAEQYYQDDVKQGKAYYGGSNNGYFGLAKGKYSQEEIIGIKNNIVKIMHEHPISFHCFLFPFRTIRPINDHETEKWKRVTTQTEKKENEKKQFYNEHNYFYPFVWPTLYDNNKDHIVHHYEYFGLDEKSNYSIIIKDDPASGKPDRYDLRLKYINLNLYNNNVGVISFYVINHDYPDPSDILKINQYGRRLFPPFADDINLHFESALRFNILGTDYTMSTKQPNEPIDLIYNLILPVLSLKPNGYNDRKTIETVIDDRMFVLSWYKNDTFSNQFQSSNLKYESFRDDDFWYKYVFVDGNDITCHNDEMQRQLICEATYPRWQKYGTLYGVSRYSMLMLTSNGCPDFLTNYFETEYVRMAELLLVQRASILNFSRRIKESVNAGNNNYEKLHHDYILFLNQIHFREVTAQEQGIEIYQMLYNKMNIGQQVKELDNEIDELHASVENRRSRQLNKGALWVAIIALIIATISMFNAIIPYQRFYYCTTPFRIEIIIVVLIACFVIFKWIKQIKKK